MEYFEPDFNQLLGPVTTDPNLSLHSVVCDLLQYCDIALQSGILAGLCYNLWVCPCFSTVGLGYGW